MRNPDFSALKYALITRLDKDDEQYPLDWTTLADAVTWLCINPLLLRGEADFFSRTAAMHVMALLIKKFGPKIRIEQAHRNLSINKNLEKIDTFSMSLSDRQQEIAGTECLSANRVAKIRQGKFANTSLAAFIELAEKEGMVAIKENNEYLVSTVSPEQAAAARDALLKIRKRLFQNSGKGRELRSQICTGFGDVGRFSLDEDNYSNVVTLQCDGLSNKRAIEVVANRTGQNIAKVKSDYQRNKNREMDDQDAALKIINKGAGVADENGYIPPLTRRDDLPPKKQNGINGFGLKRDSLSPPKLAPTDPKSSFAPDLSSVTLRE